jgi:glycosyltransferase involved in cell wall biosynthesis
VVAAAADGPRELIEDGQNGLLVPIGDDAALATALGGLMADPARAAAIGAAGRDAFLAQHAEAQVLAAWDLFLAAAARIRGGSTG